MGKSGSLLMAFAIGLSLTSCCEELVVSPLDAITFGAEESSKTLKVESNCDWNVVANNEWVSVTPTSGSDNGTIVVKARENGSVTDRQSSLNVFSASGEIYITIDITQKGASASIQTDFSSLQFAGHEGADQSLNITCNSSWNISSIPFWVDASSMKGNGNSTIKLTTNTRNNTSKAVTGDLVITSHDASVTVTLTQKGLLTSSCEVTPTDIFLLNDGAAFDFEFGKDVSFYYYGYIEVASKGSMTDDEIVEVVEEEFYRYTPEDDHLGVLTELEPGTEYYIICIGYNEEGKRGDMTKTKVKTKNSYSNFAFAEIHDVYYTETTWNWSTKIGAYAKKYYQLASSGLYAWLYGEYYAPVEIGWIINDNVKRGNFAPIVNSSEWTMDRAYDEVDLFIATLAVGDDGEYPGVMDLFYGSISESYEVAARSPEKPQQKTCYVASKSKLNKLVEASKITKVQ